MGNNKERILEDKVARIDAPAPLSRKQQIAIELAEEQLLKVRRENAEAHGRTMLADEVDGLIFEVLATFDFHLANTERELSAKMASLAKIPSIDARVIVKASFDAFRYSFRDHPLPVEAKREINAWLAIPFERREQIIAGSLQAKGKT